MTLADKEIFSSGLLNRIVDTNLEISSAAASRAVVRFSPFEFATSLDPRCKWATRLILQKVPCTRMKVTHVPPLMITDQR